VNDESTPRNEHELLDILAVREVILRFCLAVDRGDWDLVAACFTPDSTASFSGVEFGPGPQPMVDAFRSGAGSTDILSSTHFLGNIFVELDGDSARAESYTIGYLATRTSDGAALRMRGLRYRDLLRRGDDGWAIVNRVLTADWERLGPVSIP
jgi:hypothetical protein